VQGRGDGRGFNQGTTRGLIGKGKRHNRKLLSEGNRINKAKGERTFKRCSDLFWGVTFKKPFKNKSTLETTEHTPEKGKRMGEDKKELWVRKGLRKRAQNRSPAKTRDQVRGAKLRTVIK